MTGVPCKNKWKERRSDSASRPTKEWKQRPYKYHYFSASLIYRRTLFTSLNNNKLHRSIKHSEIFMKQYSEKSRKHDPKIEHSTNNLKTKRKHWTIVNNHKTSTNHNRSTKPTNYPTYKSEPIKPLEKHLRDTSNLYCHYISSISLIGETETSQIESGKTRDTRNSIFLSTLHR